MNLSDVSIRRPVFTAMMSFAILVMGILSFGRLATDLYPPVDFPFLSVRVIYPGASPRDIERDVTRPLEDAVAGIAGIDQLRSWSRDSFSLVLIKFEIGTDLAEVTNAVRDRIGSVAGDLPSGAETPIIQQIDIGALPVVVLTLSHPEGVNAARRMADDRLRPMLEQVSGVGAVEIDGGQDREIQVDLDLDKMRAYGVTLTGVQQRLGIENLSVPVGQYDAHGYTVGVRANAQFQSVADLRSTVVHTTEAGQELRLSDLATVRDDWTRRSSYVRVNGQEAVTLSVIKKSGSNTVAIAQGVKEVLREVVPKLGAGASAEIIVDQSRDIEANAHEVWVAIYFGGAMAILVILFFLLDLRGTIISALALPISVIGTFAIMAALGFSINMMSLLALSLAIGLLIDDAVVVREAITARLEAGDTPAVAASRGTSEVALAVLATTLSLVAVFVPVAFMSGMVGQFFKQFGLTMTAAVMLSLFVAFTVDPMLSSRFAVRRQHGPRTGVAGTIQRFLDQIDQLYRLALHQALSHPYLVAAASVVALAGSLVIAATLPQEFVPKEDRSEFQAEFQLPVGSDLEATDAEARRVEAELLAIKGVERVYTVVGHENRSQRARFRIRVIDKLKRTEPIDYFEARVREVLSTVPSADVSILQPAIVDGLGDWPPLMLIIQGEDMDVLLEEGRRLRDVLLAAPGTSDVRLTVEPGRPELTFNLDRQRAADRGVPAGLAALTARMLVEGEVIGALRDGAEEADIRVRADPRQANDLAAMRALPLPSGRGYVTLGEVADVQMAAGPSEIQRFNRLRSVTITTQIAPGATLGAVTEALDAALLAAPLREGYLMDIDGQARDMTETAAAMGLAITVAALFIFMVLASQFESLLHPFTLMLALPLALVGAFLALAVSGLSISMGSQIGLILLMGLVTKNAILLVDGALSHMREHGSTPTDAMRHAGPRRLRPILMTTAAMVIGMIPTATSSGVGAEFRAPMAVVVIGGVLSSTVLTLVVVPVAFVAMEGLAERMRGLWRRVAPDAGGEEAEAAK